ncbi:E3 ubiquitin-protein ligase CHIP-like [Ctenocephalides felis]|uniref:E3 ubiquitin-protein ligase CHIP-like n=1 Tax=Ctenocephalides felis TaxID=7515 RepID=UPI000E6E17BD|nr:E3 ubiquitin-protein ligase CHIP-like [Ctenocephalides felis]XP_026469302.1 E3 ubiquitin-protein ligase CHIP-like [Ctenocephalides felis]
MSKHMYSTANLTDQELKDQGNRMFSQRKYEDAANCYSKAIIKNPNMATYFTNRALCHLKLKRWDASCQDCRRALDMDSNLIKGHFFLGQALLELELYDEAIKHLQRANDLAKEQKLNFGDDIASQIRLARKKRWNVQEEKRIAQEIELQSYLNRLIKEDMENKIQQLKSENRNNEEYISQMSSEIQQNCENYARELNNLFEKVDDRRRKREVPDYLCGKISFEILNEPVITPSGITYERKDIEEHLQRVGHFDPVTRVKLTQDQLIPNFTMKEVVDSFLQENEWAIDY